jgi:hypothetical protein
MTTATDTAHAVVTSSEAGYTPAAALILALALVGAGLLGVGLFLHGLMIAQTQRFTGDVVALAGLAGYLAVWALSLLFVKNT